MALRLSLAIRDGVFMRTSLIALTAIAAAAVGAVGIIPGHEELSTVSSKGMANTEAAGEGAVSSKTDRSPSAMPVQLVADAATPDKPAVGGTAAAPNLGSSGAVERAMPAQPSAADTRSSSTAKPVVDESALRYFAARGDTVRLQAEISRLRMLYPGWQPPENPMAITTGVDSFTQSLWQTYADGRYQDVRKAIAGRQQQEPGWTPPAELLDGLRLAEARQNIVKASDDKRYDSVITLSSGAPELLTCTEIDVLWRVAEAFAKTDKSARSRDVYTYVLNNCRTPQLRIASMQKASTQLRPEAIEDLLKLEQPSPDGRPEFEPIRDDLARQMVSRAGEDDKIVVPPAELERLEKLARGDGKASDALLLGWYNYRRKNMTVAEEWFRRSYSSQASAGAAQGLALALISRGVPDEAENVMFPFQETDKQAKSVYLSAVAELLAQEPPKMIDNPVLSRMAPVVIAAHDVAAAEQFGWYARTLQQMPTAADWFRLVLSWDPTHEPAAYGLGLSLDSLQDKAGLARVKADWAGRSERIAKIGEVRGVNGKVVAVPSSMQEPAREPSRPTRTTMVALSGADEARAQPRSVRAGVSAKRSCSDTIDPSLMAPQDALVRGWCLMDMKRPMEAVNAFDRALLGQSLQQRQDAAYGKSLAFLRLKLTDKAAAAAASVPLVEARARELQLAILADRAVGAFQLGRPREALIALDQRSRLMPEPQDLLLLRGYAYQKLGYNAEARQIFQTLSDIGNTSALKALAEIRANDPGEGQGG